MSVVVPVKDEAATIDELVRRIDDVLAARPGGYEIVVVDDDSRPDDLDHLRASATGPVPFRLVELDGHYGQVSALVCGLAQSRGAAVVTMDGDLQDPPEELPVLLDALGPDIAVAKGARREQHGSWWRRLASPAMSRLAGALVGVHLGDFGGQYNAYTRPAADEIVARWRRHMAVIPLACHLGLAVREVDVRRSARAVGRSRYGVGALAIMATDLVIDFASPRWRRVAGALTFGWVPWRAHRLAILRQAPPYRIRSVVAGPGPGGDR